MNNAVATLTPAQRAWVSFLAPSVTLLLMVLLATAA